MTDRCSAGSLDDVADTIGTPALGGRYQEQAQKWVLMRFTGTDADIDLFRHKPPEFDAWRWVSPPELLASIVAFKRPVYEQVLSIFAEDLERLRQRGPA